VSEEAAWARINVASAARDALGLMEDELKAEQYRIDMQAYAALDTGRLTSEVALGYFASKWAMYTLQKKLLQKAKQGESAVLRIPQTLG
jgi:hypothetical protein